MNQAYKEKILAQLTQKVERMIDQIGSKTPHVAKADGVYDSTSDNWWTSGFWPGLLWVMYDATGKEPFRAAAWEWDAKLARCFSEHPIELHHDVGFQFLPTAVIKYELTGDQEALRIGLEAANYLAGRFNPNGEFIRAWNGPDVHGWAIVDCMMNIPLLFWASRTTGDPRYKHIAIRHADTFLRHAIREDGSVCHILSFDPESGAFIESLGGQGLSGSSAWSRGNAWAVYGLAIAYRCTGLERYLHASKRVAHYFIAALPEDHVPYWDFRVETLDNEPRDSSAAAIAASGLLELAGLVPPSEQRIYATAANKMLFSLSENYATWNSPEHEAILVQGTGHKPANANINVSLIYGDYYFAEAFAKLNGWSRRIF